MGVLILLIVVDLLVIGTVMYFVFSEKEQKHEHYVPVQQAEARDWAVQTTSDAEVKGASAEKALTGGELDHIHEPSLPADSHPVTLGEAAEETSEEAEELIEAVDELEKEDGDTESKTQSS